jgi:hypothetical protein
LVILNVGSLRGASGDDDTISWPFAAKKFKKVDLISLTPLMFIQSGGVRSPLASHFNVELGQIAASQTAFRQGRPPCPETVQRDQWVASIHSIPVDSCSGRVDSLGWPVFCSYL